MNVCVESRPVYVLVCAMTRASSLWQRVQVVSKESFNSLRALQHAGSDLQGRNAFCARVLVVSSCMLPYIPVFMQLESSYSSVGKACSWIWII